MTVTINEGGAVIDHLTYHVPEEVLNDPELEKFFTALGMEALDEAVQDTLEQGWNVRWFASLKPSPIGPPTPLRPVVHLVATEDGDRDQLSLGHFCIRVGAARFDTCRESRWCTRDSGSGRCWLEFDHTEVAWPSIRVEVRP